MHVRRLAAAAAAIVLPVAYAGSAQAATVAALWHMNEKAGATTMVDSSGKGNNGRIVGVQTGVPGKSGTAYRFNGRSSYVLVPSKPVLNPGSRRLVVQIWLRVPSTLPAGKYNVMQKGLNNTAGGQYKMEIGGTAALLGRPLCSFTDAAKRVGFVSAKKTIADNAWHRVDCVRSGNTVSVLIDGKVSNSHNFTLSTISNSAPVVLGARVTGKGFANQFYLGDMDEVSIRIG